MEEGRGRKNQEIMVRRGEMESCGGGVGVKE